jgi:Tfp pilus assembly protein PilW
VAAFLTVLAHCRDRFDANESLARLEDAARHAVSVLGADIEHAGFYGFSSIAPPQLVRGGAVIADATQLRQGDAAAPVAPVSGLPAGAHDCGTNFAVDLGMPVEGSNNAPRLAGRARLRRPPRQSGARAGVMR